ncbi:MAG: T9SS type A sorting domain-containing protein [Chitinophagaceae bacterium]|nr:T9SS type A sorting domain-containing protein [Chitinophagaceae bacterium]
MKKHLHKIILLTSLIILSVSTGIKAQVAEWRLNNVVYSSVDPDGGGPAKGSVTFTMQIHAVSTSIINITGISTGWSWQSANAMLPTGAPCGTNSVAQPSNITMSAAFTGFTYNNVNECSGSVNFSTGGQTFDRRSAGTIDGGTITLTSTWVDVFTVTLWALGNVSPEAGYVVINSSDIGTPAPFATYALSDDQANEYAVNSLTYAVPLQLTSGALPVLFTKFDASCTGNGAMIRWSTGSEFNSNYFEVQRSTNGTDWTVVGNVKAAGSSNSARNYQQLDLTSGPSFYRIKQVDQDGHASYTSVARTSCERKNIELVIYPVPARDVLNVVIQTDRSLKTQLVVYDGIGKLVRRMDASIISGNNNFTLNLRGLSAGEYVIRSSDPSVNLDKKFTIVR